MPGASTSERELGRRRFSLSQIMLQGRAFVALAVIFVVFSFLAPDSFPTVTNVLMMCQQVSVYALIALGMLLVVMDGGIDLSVGSTLGLSGMVAGLALQGIPIGGVVLYPPVWVVVVLALATGAVVGLLNGVLVARLSVAPFVATLGTQYMVRGIAELTTNGLTVNNLNGDPSLGNTGFEWLGFNRIADIYIGIWFMVLIAIITSLLLNRSVYGRWLYAQGGNRRAAELSGVPVRSVTIRTYVLSGLFAALAGVMLTSQLTAAGPTQGTSYELTAIAAVVIGGASLMGGTGNVRGTLVGAFVIGFLAAGLTIIGISSYVQTVFTGAVIILAVLMNSIQVRSRRRRSTTGADSPPVSPVAGGDTVVLTQGNGGQTAEIPAEATGAN